VSIALNKLGTFRRIVDLGSEMIIWVTANDKIGCCEMFNHSGIICTLVNKLPVSFLLAVPEFLRKSCGCGLNHAYFPCMFYCRFSFPYRRDLKGLSGQMKQGSKVISIGRF
jgi:hypothetical protein